MGVIVYGEQLHRQLLANASSESRIWQNTILKDGKNGGLVTNAIGGLKYDDYKELTDEVIKVREWDFVGNLYRTMSVNKRAVSIFKTQIDYKTMNDFGAAEVSMNASNRQNEQTNYGQNVMPLPLIHKDFVIPWRESGFSYKEADGRDEAFFRVMETRDLVLLNGASNITLNGEQLWGYTNHPATIKKAGGISDWALAANKGSVYDEYVSLVSDLSIGGKTLAPNSLAVFVATDVYTALQRKTGTQTGGTDMKLMSQIEDHAMTRSVQPLQDLPDGAVLLIDMAPTTSDIVESTDIRAVPWQRQNELEDIRLTVLAGAVARIKVDRNDRTRVLFATKA